MNTKLKYGLAALGLAVSVNAQADLLGSAIMNISNIRFVDATGGTPGALLDQSNFIINGGTSASTNAVLNGTSSLGNDNGIGGPFDTIDLTQSCIGSGCSPFAENDFSAQPVPPAVPTDTYSLSDMELGGNGFNGTGFSSTRADVSLVGAPQDGQSNTDGAASASIEFTPTGNVNVGILFDFDVFSRAFASTVDDVVITTQNAFTVSLTGPDILPIIATPVFSNATIADAIDDIIISSSNTNVFVDLGALTSGLTYQFGLAAASQVSAFNVPEPGTMALLGLGLAGVGFAGKRKRVKAAA